jgi:hypothetical protein
MGDVLKSNFDVFTRESFLMLVVFCRNYDSTLLQAWTKKCPPPCEAKFGEALTACLVGQNIVNFGLYDCIIGGEFIIVEK